MGKHSAVTAEEVAGIADDGIATQDPHRFADELEEWTASQQMGWEPVSDTGDSLIANVYAADGNYRATLTISRTPGC